ncbi:hypothetical protein ScPMuIL_008633 [Solemya velum]
MSYFSYVGKLFSNFKGFYNEINAATLTGAIDTIIVQQEDGSYLSSPFHVRFGKMGVLRAKEKLVDIEINGKPVDLQMKLGEAGVAFFVQSIAEQGEDVPAHLATSPLPSGAELMEEGVKDLKEQAENIPAHTPPLGVERTEVLEPIQPVPTLTVQEVKSYMSVDEADVDTLATEHSIKTKKRRKRKTERKRSMSLGGLKEDMGRDEDIFDIELDESTDEEISAINEMSRSVSLPNTEECRLQMTDDWATAQYETLLHPFSDTDITPVGSPRGSRPSSPKSDTEVEIQKQNMAKQTLLTGEDDTLWEWGNLPQTSSKSSMKSKTVSAAEQENTASSGLLGFMRKTKSVRHKPELEGIYLDDLKLDEMDPEVVKLYFPKKFATSQFQSIKEKEEDVESGRGASLPQSPHSVEGAIGGPTVSFLRSEVQHLGMFSLSLCGGLTDPEGVNLEKFMQKVVTYGDLCENPTMTNNPDLVVRVGDKYYNWQTAAPLILSHAVFQKELPDLLVSNLVREHMPKKKEKKTGVSSWFSWRRPATDESSTVLNSSGVLAVISVSESEVTSKQNELAQALPPSGTSSVTSTPRKVKPASPERSSDEVVSSDAEVDVEFIEKGSIQAQSDPVDVSPTEKSTEKYKKTLRLTSEQIEKLNLQEGRNEISFSVTTQYQGTTRCTSHIYLWKSNDKIIVSDIDGTITKSDVLGQILPIIGRDWSQSGVAQLYSRISSNKYKFLYLSARAIGQSKITKDLLKNIKQNDLVLPDGPLLLSPTSLISAFHREVIEKKPEEFKISCLQDIANLFPKPHRPFYAGFGNKVNDVYAYKAMDIPVFRIFTINHRGELKHEQSYTFQSTYESLSDIADYFFPPIQNTPGTPAIEFSSVNYWRSLLPEISEQELNHISKRRKESKEKK